MRRSLIHIVSKNRPMVCMSFIRSAGPIPRAAVPIEGSEKYLVSVVRMAVLLLRFGFHAGASSSTKIFFSALIYDETVSRMSVAFSFVSMSAQMVLIGVCPV